MKKDIEFNGQDLVNSVESFAKSLPMRPLKFRAWDNVNKRFYPQNILNALPLDVFLASEHIQQFTGLKDSKNNEIYEGDILNQLLDNKPCYYVVEWGNQSDYCGFGLRPLMKRGGTFRTTIHDFKMYLAEGFEVIGNIFEHSELLK